MVERARGENVSCQVIEIKEDTGIIRKKLEEVPKVREDKIEEISRVRSIP